MLPSFDCNMSEARRFYFEILGISCFVYCFCI